MLILFLGLLAGGNIYLSKRFAYFFQIEKVRQLYFLFAFFTLFMIAGVALFTNGLSLISTILYGSAAILMGFLLYLLLSTILIDLVNLIIKIKPGIQGIATISLAVGISVFGIWNSQNFRITEKNIQAWGITKDLKAVHLSDIHLGHFRGNGFMQKLVNETNRLNPDLIFITGDLFDGKIRINDQTFETLKNFEAPVYFVEGNHDVYSGTDTIKTLLKKNGINVLENELVLSHNLQIIGLNHLPADENSPGRQIKENHTIKSILNALETDTNRYTILLHHSPDGMFYANDKGVDLYLSGHTHAGQLFPVTLINELIFKYNRGEYNFYDTKIIVSEGIGTFGPPMRVGTKSEIIVLNLIKDTNNEK